MTFSPSLGRWLQEDPTGFTAGDPNLSRFVGNNPARFTDPSGLVVAMPEGLPGNIAGRLTELGIEVRRFPDVNEYRSTDGRIRIRWDQPHGNVPPHWDIQGFPGATDERGRAAHARVTAGGRGVDVNGRDTRVLREAGITAEPRRGGGGGGGGGRVRRPGYVDPRALVALGVIGVAVGGVTYGYDRLITEGERVGTELATRVGLGRRLQILGAAGMLPAGCTFDLVRGGGQPTIHVVMVQRDNQWYFTAWHTEHRSGFLWLAPHRVTVEDIRLGDVPAHHTPRPLPAEGSLWEEITRVPPQVEAIMRGEDPGPPAPQGGGRPPANGQPIPNV